MVNSRLCETARPAGFKIRDRDLKKDNRDPKKTLETHQKRLRDFQIRPKFSTTYIFQGTILYRFSCCLWTEVCIIPAFLHSPSHLLVSAFQVIYFELPITRTFLDFPRRFELPGVDSGYFCIRWRSQKLQARPCFSWIPWNIWRYELILLREWWRVYIALTGCIFTGVRKELNILLTHRSLTSTC